MAAASQITQPLQFHEGQINPREGARVGWFALRQALRSWRFALREHLTAVGREGFQATLPGKHISARAQEALLSRARAGDARVALLESVFVAMVLHVGRQSSVPVGGFAAEPAPQNPVPVSEEWAQLDAVDLQLVFPR